MNVFLTGRTGYVGGAVLRALVGAGHSVTALVRRGGASQRVEGVREVVGDLGRPEEWVEAAGRAEAVVHCALQYTEDGAEVGALDAAVVRVLRDAAGPSGHLVYTSSLFEPRAEGAGPLAEALDGASRGWRAEVEEAVLAGPAEGAVIRLGFVYGGAGGYLWDMLAPGPDGTVRYALPGAARWPFVHVDDLADLYLQVVEARATGVFHAAAGEPVPVAEVAAIVGGLVGAPAAGLAPENAVRELPHVGALMLRDVDPERRRARELGWRTRHDSFERSVPAAYRAYLASR